MNDYILHKLTSRQDFLPGVFIIFLVLAGYPWLPVPASSYTVKSPSLVPSQEK